VVPLSRENFIKRFGALGSALTESELETLFAALEVHHVPAGAALIAEDTATDALYLVWEGELDIVIETPSGKYEIARVGPGEMLGEVSLLDPGAATATVRASAGATALVLSRPRLEALWRSEPRVASAFLRELTHALAVRIRAASARLNHLLMAKSGDVRDEALLVQTVLHKGAR
jgi:CRP-like cAMP-binding protein